MISKSKSGRGLTRRLTSEGGEERVRQVSVDGVFCCYICHCLLVAVGFMGNTAPPSASHLYISCLFSAKYKVSNFIRYVRESDLMAHCRFNVFLVYL